MKSTAAVAHSLGSPSSCWDRLDAAFKRVSIESTAGSNWQAAWGRPTWINTTRVPDLGSAIRAVVDRGVNFMIDAAGSDTLIAMALSGLARRGTLGLVAAPPSAERKLDVPSTAVLVQGQAVRGFVEGNSIPDIFIPRLIDVYAQGRFPFDKLVRFYPFDEINRAVEDQRNGIAIKPILEVAAA